MKTYFSAALIAALASAEHIVESIDSATASPVVTTNLITAATPVTANTAGYLLSLETYGVDGLDRDHVRWLVGKLIFTTSALPLLADIHVGFLFKKVDDDDDDMYEQKDDDHYGMEKLEGYDGLDVKYNFITASLTTPYFEPIDTYRTETSATPPAIDIWTNGPVASEFKIDEKNAWSIRADESSITCDG